MKPIYKNTLAGVGGLATLYLITVLFSFKTYPVIYGLNFDPSQARWLGLDSQKTYTAILNELQPPILRLSARMDEIEPAPGRFDFKQLDWYMNQAAQAKSKVLLVVGQKTPRWPECHLPPWFVATSLQAKEEFLTFEKIVLNRYKNHPALELWQIENEPFIKFNFGQCPNFQSTWVEAEVALARSTDPTHKIVVTDSGEFGLWDQAGRLADIFGSTLYRQTRSNQGWAVKYFWMNPGMMRLHSMLIGKTGSNFIISELQAEPWFTPAQLTTSTRLTDPTTMSPQKLAAALWFANRTSASRAYFWGSEWWYFMKTQQNDPSYWNIASRAINGTKQGVVSP